MNYNEALEKVSKLNQEHLLKYYNELNKEEQEHLLKQIEEQNLESVLDLYNELVVNKTEIKKDEIKNIDSININSIDKETKEELYSLGLNSLKNGEVAAFLVAGGQGSRLGFNGPKGAYDIGLPSHKTLFQMQAERLLNISKKANKFVPWYIMTSPGNNEYTQNHFKENNYFGYDKDSIYFFMQENIPSVDENGKIIMDSKNNISLNPNGSGGCFMALKENGLLDNMIDRKIKYVFFYGVDNILVKMCDPYLIGYAIKNNKDITSKSVVKNVYSEKVGVYAYRNNKPSIIEYSEMPEEMAKETGHDGQLLYRSANINAQVFKIEFLIEALKHKPLYHVAHKKITYLDENGILVEPTKENAYKFESFFFDFFNHADDMAVLDSNREEEFAPVKNLTGVDSKDTAREMVCNLHKKWLLQLGFKESEIPNPIEISPILSYDGKDITKDDIKELIKDKNTHYIK